MTLSEYGSWIGAGAFFLFLVALQVLMVFVLFRKRRFD